MNRSLLARIWAKGLLPRPGRAKVNEPVVTDPEKPREKILAKDPETGRLVHTFASLEEAEKKGFRVANIKSSMKTGNKYKGHLWESSK